MQCNLGVHFCAMHIWLHCISMSMLCIFPAYWVECTVQMLQYLVFGELSESAFNWMGPVGV